MVAPRAILVVSNTAIDRLGSQAGYASMKAATEVYKALGVPDRIGFTQAAASSHCVFPSSQTQDVSAFVDKFLLGKTTANTSIARGAVLDRHEQVGHLEHADAEVSMGGLSAESPGIRRAHWPAGATTSSYSKS
jgi:hypothetical protein